MMMEVVDYEFREPRLNKAGLFVQPDGSLIPLISLAKFVTIKLRFCLLHW